MRSTRRRKRAGLTIVRMLVTGLVLALLAAAFVKLKVFEVGSEKIRSRHSNRRRPLGRPRRLGLWLKMVNPVVSAELDDLSFSQAGRWVSILCDATIEIQRVAFLVGRLLAFLFSLNSSVSTANRFGSAVSHSQITTTSHPIPSS